MQKLIFFVFTYLLFSPTTWAQSLACNRRQSANQCLVCNCYHESRGESYKGKIAVAKAVMTRTKTKGYVGSVCKVVYAFHQFSWTWDDIPNDISAKFPEDKKGLLECKQVADVALREGGNGILSFYAGATPYWADDMKFCAKEGRHNFLVKKDGKCPSSVTGSVSAKAGVSADGNARLKGKIGGQAGGGLR